MFWLLFVATARAFVHPGLLHTADDLTRVRSFVENGNEPWTTSWELLTSNRHASASWIAAPAVTVYRGDDGVHDQNFSQLYNDIHAAYQLAIRWLISGDTSFADASVAILNSWSWNLTAIAGNGDKYIAAGIYGYQMANAAELMRSYSGWALSDQEQMKKMLTKVFYSLNTEFLAGVNNFGGGYAFASWDFLSLASIMAIGVFNDDKDKYDQAIYYFWNGNGNGNFNKFIYHNWTEDTTKKILAQTQEAGRDQNHALLDIQLMGVIMQQAYNQGDDLYAALGNSGLHASEYMSKYNVGQDVPFTWIETYEGNHTIIAPDGRYELRPGWERIYAHYNGIKGLDATWTKVYREMVNGNTTNRVEGGGGDYGPNSGGYDDLGYGTLLYRLS